MQHPQSTTETTHVIRHNSRKLCPVNSSRVHPNEISSSQSFILAFQTDLHNYWKFKGALSVSQYIYSTILGFNGVGDIDFSRGLRELNPRAQGIIPC